MISELRTRLSADGVKVLLLEQDASTRDVLVAAFESLGCTVLTESDGVGMERATRFFRPDVTLIDVRPDDGVDGIEVARWLRAHHDVPIVFLGADGDTGHVIEAFEAGADDYLPKPFVVSELVARMRAVLRRSGRSTRPVHAAGDLHVDVRAHIATRAGRQLDLTQREFAILAALCEHAGSILSKAQLMADVWGGLDRFGLNVVEVHVSSLRRKLETHGPRMIHTVRGIGYVLRP
jgi:two-component system OmpR family response regulator